MASGRAQPIERADDTTRQPHAPGSDIESLRQAGSA